MTVPSDCSSTDSLDSNPGFERAVHRAPLSAKIVTLVVVILPFLGLLAAAILLWGWGLSWVELTLLGSMYAITGLGVTVGFHRYFTHRSFETNRIVQFVLGVMGSMAVQGPLLEWVAFHRRHHQHSDKQEDPHSPHHYGSNVVGVLKGFYHAHMGWFFLPHPPKLTRYVQDLRASRLARWISNLFPVWVLLGLALPAVLGWLLIGGWMGLLLGVLWGGFVRIFLVHHLTWSINSICHLWGQQPYKNRDESRNNFLFGLLGFGEGWHNNHHAYPTSARHGFRWWQIDFSWYVIAGLWLFGLAWNMKLPGEMALGE